MTFLRWLSQMRDLPWYILTRCAILACVMLGSTLLALVWATASGAAAPLLWRYAHDTIALAPVVLLSGLFASAFLEQILDRR